jgi:biopolymer transport protein TolQ
MSSPIAAPSAGVKALSAASSAAGKMSVLEMFWQADFVVKLVMVLLILASIWSWAIIFDKLVYLRNLKRKMDRFDKEFWTSASLKAMLEKIKGKENQPLAYIFAAAMEEYNYYNRNGSSSRIASAKERVQQTMQVSSNKSIETIEKNLTFLATVGSAAPFIGLFGTVWGIMVSFQSIAVSKSTNLAAVAPGIAEALLATAFGLVAAIPAVIFYNRFASEANKMASRINDFCIELSAIISREIDR